VKVVVHECSEKTVCLVLDITAVVLKVFEIAYHLVFFNVGVHSPGFRIT